MSKCPYCGNKIEVKLSLYPKTPKTFYRRVLEIFSSNPGLFKILLLFIVVSCLMFLLGLSMDLRLEGY